MKKKGFTLIELLAVIVILAIIALIITPLISDLIESSRYASAVDSVLAYVAGANSQAAADSSIGGFEDFSLNLPEENELETGITDEELAKIKYKGKGPTYVYLHFAGEDKYVSEGKFCMWGYSIDYNSYTGATKSDLNYCGDAEPEGEPTCDVLNNNKYSDTAVFKINNVEDLVCLSEMSKSGKTFSGKTIYLIKDIDFDSDISYSNPNGTDYGDINGNGEVEGIKTELTTSGGFYPIGIDTAFEGTFEGYAKSISNLVINRSLNNVGLIGINKGTVRGFNITSTVTGNTNVGGVVGYNNGGTVNELVVSSSVNGSNLKGGVVGRSTGGLVTNILVNNVVISNGNSSNDSRGGILGGNCDTQTTLTGIVERGTIGGNYYAAKVSGECNVKPAGTAYASNNVTGGSYNQYGSNGTSYTLVDEMLNAYDNVLDTYIAGDNDESGYYFDYESDDSSKIVIKRTTKNPVKFTLKGNGTSNDPYIVDNIQRYKEASLLAGSKNEDGTYKNYKLKITEDINFEGKHYYALGTTTNVFGGDIDGDMHTLSNIAFACIGNCGLASTNAHTIEALKLDNITISSSGDNVGGLVGVNTGTIQGIIATNINVTGVTSVGGLVGANDAGTVNEVIVSSNVNGSNLKGGVVGWSKGGMITNTLVNNVVISNGNGNNDSRGGILGGNCDVQTTVSGVVERGIIGGNYYASKVVGQCSVSPAIIAYASNNVTGGSNNQYGSNGNGYTLSTEMLNAYDKALDTYIGGDNDDSKYYFDYESDDSSNIVLKRTKDAPITFTLSGSGTSTSPYIIDSYQHFKEATTIAKDNFKFKITSDIDFTGKHYYALGTNGNELGSDIDGDMHTLSNITFACAENCGLISKNSRTIEGINLNNVSITSGNSNIGGLVGYNTGTIKGINATNINVSGDSSIGGLVGANNAGIVHEVTVTSNINGSNLKGGVVGWSKGGAITSTLVKNVVISNGNGNNDSRGGILGGNEATATAIIGVVEQGAVGGNYYGSKVAGHYDIKPSVNAYSSYLISGGNDYNDKGSSGTRYTLVLPATVTYSSTEVDSLSYYDSVGVLDTIIGGDNDSSGYYLQYNNAGDSIVVVKSGTALSNDNPNSNIDPTIGVPIEGESVGTNPPICVLNQVIPRSAGIQAVLTCEDEEGAPIIRSQWNVNKNATTNQFTDIGIVKEGTVNGNSKTVRPYWSTSNTISKPSPNDCYYYRFGAMDASGNWSYYVTKDCYYGFSN